MSDTFVISDTHFGHNSVVTKFKNADGSPLRPFDSVEEMDEEMVKRWNSVVSPTSRVLHLGDVVINKKFLPIMDRLNGTKDLLLGNHDIHFVALLAPYFREINAYKVKGDLIFSHIPVHEQCIERFGANVHGHLHEKKITWNRRVLVTDKWEDGFTRDRLANRDVPDPRYLNVCVEHTNFQPITLDEVRKRVKDQQEAAGYVPPQVWGNGSKPVEMV